MNAEFASTVSNDDSIVSLHGLSVSDWDHKRVNTIFLAFDNELGPNYSLVRCLGCSSNPKFVSCLSWSVEEKTFRLMVIYSFSLKVLCVATMANLSKSKAS